MNIWLLWNILKAKMNWMLKIKFKTQRITRKQYIEIVAFFWLEKRWLWLNIEDANKNESVQLCQYPHSHSPYIYCCYLNNSFKLVFDYDQKMNMRVSENWVLKTTNAIFNIAIMEILVRKSKAHIKTYIFVKTI